MGCNFRNGHKAEIAVAMFLNLEPADSARQENDNIENQRGRTPARHGRRSGPNGGKFFVSFFQKRKRFLL
jgi:hypothetical protein